MVKAASQVGVEKTNFKVNCQSCGHEVPPSAVNFQLAIFHCVHCNTAYRIKSNEPQVDPREIVAQFRRENPELEKESPFPSAPIEKPKGVSVVGEAGSLRIRSRSFSSKSLLFAFIVACWVTAVTAFVVYSIQYEPTMAVIGIPHCFISVGLIYWAACTLLNTTEVSIANGTLSVRYYPIPVIGAVSVATDEVSQVFVHRLLHYSKGYHHVLYGMIACLSDGRKIRLLYGYESAHIPLYIEQILEQELNLNREKVPGRVLPEELVANP